VSSPVAKPVSNLSVFKLEYRAYVEALADALIREDDQTFFEAVDHIVHLREPEMFGEVRKLTGDLQTALERFSVESRLADIAENDIPDARQRLLHVINLTDVAAHKTLDLVERSGPLAESTAREAAMLLDEWQRYRVLVGSDLEHEDLMKRVDAFLPSAQRESETIRRNLADVLMAQGYQDLTGQIIRGVMKLVEELESALAELRKLSGDVVEHAQMGDREEHGPVIPGVTKSSVAEGQQDVDALLSGHGL